MGGGIGLAGLSKQVIALDTWFELGRILSRFCRERDEPIFQGCCLYETSPLRHDALLFVRGRRERNRAFSAPINAMGLTVMTHQSTGRRILLSTRAHKRNYDALPFAGAGESAGAISGSAATNLAIGN
jgi:hypothetical protein